VIVGADSKYVIGKIGNGPKLRISEHGWVVENPSPIHNFRIGRKAPVMENISRAYLVGTFIDTLSCIGNVDLVELFFDSDVVFEIVGRIESVSLNFCGL
jgi:hypothetical protein